MTQTKTVTHPFTCKMTFAPIPGGTRLEIWPHDNLGDGDYQFKSLYMDVLVDLGQEDGAFEIGFVNPVLSEQSLTSTAEYYGGENQLLEIAIEMNPEFPALPKGAIGEILFKGIYVNLGAEGSGIITLEEESSL